MYPFVGIPTFLRAPVAESATGARLAVLGVPFDEGSPFIPGSRFGPRAIREQSMRFASAPDSRFDVRSGRRLLDIADGELVDLGDVEVVAADPPTTTGNITASVREVVAAGAVPVVL